MDHDIKYIRIEQVLSIARKVELLREKLYAAEEHLAAALDAPPPEPKLVKSPDLDDLIDPPAPAASLADFEVSPRASNPAPTHAPGNPSVRNPRAESLARTLAVVREAGSGGTSYREVAARFPTYDGTSANHWLGTLVRLGKIRRAARGRYVYVRG
jgi:hypothetical protein